MLLKFQYEKEEILLLSYPDPNVVISVSFHHMYVFCLPLRLE